MKSLFQLIGIILQISFEAVIVATLLLITVIFIGIMHDWIKRRFNKNYESSRNWLGLFIRSLLALAAVLILYFSVNVISFYLIPCEWGGLCIKDLPSHY
jgi:hypothetical protein